MTSPASQQPTYKASITRSWNETKGGTEIIVTINEALRNLLKNFSCAPELRDSSIAKNPSNSETTTWDGSFLQRYTVKSALRERLSALSGQWSAISEILFMPEIMTDCTVSIIAGTLRFDIDAELRRLKTLIEAAEGLLRRESTNATFTIEVTP